jgi:hypothetical protein
MKGTLAVAIFVALVTTSFAEERRPRSMRDIPEAERVLLKSVSPKFYKSLLVSPIEGWITARGQLSGDHLAGARIVRSDLSGEYDSLALELANNLRIQAYNQSSTLAAARSILVHVLLYQVKDGRLAVSFANFDEPGGTQLKYTGAAWMAVEKANHRWITIEPLRLAPHEHRGPRAYTIAVEAPGNTRLGRAVGYPVMRSR